MSRFDSLVITDIVYEYPDVKSRANDFRLSVSALRFPAGSIVTLTGDNGSGKTTLLKIIAGLIVPDSGRIETENNGMMKERPSSTLVHQDPYLLGGTVRRNLLFALRGRPVPKVQRRRLMEECLDAVGMTGYRKRRANGLSGGEQKRVAIARALALDPDALLLDEPTANMDASSVAKLEQAVERIARSGKTVVIASHDMAFSFRVSDSVVRLQSGSVVPIGRNVFRGRLERTDGEFGYFVSNGIRIRCPDTAGAYRTAVVPYSDVILSNERFDSSAQNQLSGVVTNVERFDPSGHRYTVAVDCGIEVCAVITGYSVENLGIRPGASVYAVFKSASIRLY